MVQSTHARPAFLSPQPDIGWGPCAPCGRNPLSFRFVDRRLGPTPLGSGVTHLICD